MASNMICYPNRVEKAALYGGSWEPSLPVTNLQSRFLSQYARTTDVSLSAGVIEVDFDKLRYVTAFALVRHNLSLTASCRLQLWTDTGRTVCVYDSGEQLVWPRRYSTMQLKWGSRNFWGGKIDEEELEGISPLFVYLLTASSGVLKKVSARSATITLKDPLNLDGFIQIGRMYLADGWVPAINCSYGATVGWVDPTIVDTSLNGTEYFEERAKYREVVFKLEFMNEAEGVNRAMHLSQNRGVSKDVLFIWDPDNAYLMQQRSFVGRLEELSPLEFPQWSITSMGFKIKELV